MILNIHALTSRSRMTNFQHSLFLQRHLGAEKVYSMNVLLYDPLSWTPQRFRLCVINYEVVAYRSSPLWPYIEGRLKQILGFCENKILIVQDDYTCNLQLQNFINKYSIDVVFSSVQNDLHKLYKSNIDTGVRIEYLPTGLVEANDLSLYEKAANSFNTRKFGTFASYRNLPRYFGVKAATKSELVKTWKATLDSNVSQDFELVLGNNVFGTNWLSKMAEYQFAIHHKGGASLIDKVGELRSISKLLGEKRLITKKVITLIERNSSRVGDFSASGPRLVEAILLKCVILAPPAHYELGLINNDSYIEIDPRNPIASIEKLRCHDPHDWELFTANALSVLQSDRRFHYCDRAIEILHYAEGGHSSIASLAHDHGPDVITSLFISISNLSSSYSKSFSIDSVANPILRSLITKFDFDSIDLYFLKHLDSVMKAISEECLSLIFLNRINGIPIAL